MKSKVLLLLAIIVMSALVLGCTTPEKTVKAGDTVSVDYVGTYTNGTIFDTSNATIAQASGAYNPARAYTPFSFVAGSNDTIKGFDEAVMGMKLNETKNVTVPPEKAYGEFNASKVITTPLVELKGNNTNFSLYVGEQIRYNDDYIYVVSVGKTNDTALIIPLSRLSNYAPYTITPNPENNTATLDYNNPLAGKVLNFRITVLDIKTK
jgi:peptidylprolyl isomerase